MSVIRSVVQGAGAVDSSIWHKVAGISGFAAVAMGAYGAHGFKPENETYKEVWKTANLYHLAHTAALLAAPLVRHPHVYGGLMTFGIVAFSGSCYVAAVYENRKLAGPAPFGGFALMAGWLTALF
eukprot:jgi/Mesen1/6962/ME000360S06226